MEHTLNLPEEASVIYVEDEIIITFAEEESWDY